MSKPTKERFRTWFHKSNHWEQWRPLFPLPLLAEVSIPVISHVITSLYYCSLCGRYWAITEHITSLQKWKSATSLSQFSIKSVKTIFTNDSALRNWKELLLLRRYRSKLMLWHLQLEQKIGLYFTTALQLWAPFMQFQLRDTMLLKIVLIRWNWLWCHLSMSEM